jgi:uncharacterized membrane protein YcfT
VKAVDGRVAWIDCAKGICIALVVLMHATLGVEAAAGQNGWLHPFVAFAQPFRIPAFFLMAGLLMPRAIDRDWRSFFDRKVLHFVYFYVLWVTIQIALRFPGYVKEAGVWAAGARYLDVFVEPFGTLWFIYLLPIFFVVVKATRNISPLLIWPIASALEIAPIETGSTVVDEFAARFVYFYTGYVLARSVFMLAAWTDRRRLFAGLALVLWGAVNGALVVDGLATAPLISLALGLLGAAAIVALSVLLTASNAAAPLRHCGRHSLIIYLGFTVPMAATAKLLLASGLIADIGSISALVTAAAIAGPLVLHRIVRATPLRFLFERPQSFRLPPSLQLAPQR